MRSMYWSNSTSLSSAIPDIFVSQGHLLPIYFEGSAAIILDQPPTGPLIMPDVSSSLLVMMSDEPLGFFPIQMSFLACSDEPSGWLPVLPLCWPPVMPSEPWSGPRQLWAIWNFFTLSQDWWRVFDSKYYLCFSFHRCCLIWSEHFHLWVFYLDYQHLVFLIFNLPTLWDVGNNAAPMGILTITG